MWWKELRSILGLTNCQKFAQKIWACHFIYRKSSLGCSQKKGIPCLLPPESLNRGVYLPDNLAYQDAKGSSPHFSPVAYCRCLQNWVEKCNLPRNPDFNPLAESVRELRQAICKFVNITREDVINGLEMEEPEGGHQLPPTTIFSHVLKPPANRQEADESSTRTRNRAIKCAPPTLRLERDDQFVLVITSLMSQLTIEPGNGNIKRGRNLLRSH